jgi:hypothetical protein
MKELITTRSDHQFSILQLPSEKYSNMDRIGNEFWVKVNEHVI